MQNIIIGRYSNPANIGFWGWVEPQDRSWILFLPVDDGPPVVYPKRDKDTGAVIEGE